MKKKNSNEKKYLTKYKFINQPKNTFLQATQPTILRNYNVITT